MAAVMTAVLDIPYKVVLVANPWRAMLPDAELTDLLDGVARERAASIRQRYASGEGPYDRGAMAFVLLDPTAVPQEYSEDTAMAYILIGDEAISFLPNAMAKACEQRDFGVGAGTLVYVQPHRLAGGSFLWGHSAVFEGQIVGSSGETQQDDRCEAGHLAVDFVWALGSTLGRWITEHRDGRDYRWLSTDNEPASRFTQLMSLRVLGTCGTME